MILNLKLHSHQLLQQTHQTDSLNLMLVNWGDATVKAGMFDDQNGFFYKYDGSTLYAVRRTATQQISGQLTVDQTSTIITGTDTQFTRQLTFRIQTSNQRSNL